MLNIAHRGASADAPENTIAAIDRAIQDGADLVEVDVHRSRDGGLVLLHDTTLHRTTDARARFPHRSPWRVDDFTVDELQRLDAGGWFCSLHAGARIPTLQEAFDALRGTGVGIQIELKAPAAAPGVVRDLAHALSARPVDMAGVAVQSFDFAAMKELKTRVPEVPVGLLGRPVSENLTALATWADQVNPSHLAVDRSYVDKLHDLGLECLVWTVDRSFGMRRAARLGVDGIITNRPGALAGLLSGSRRFGVRAPG